MKFSLSRQKARLFRRIKRYVKKSQDLRRSLLVLVAIWLVIPALTANAADVASEPVLSSGTSVSLDSSLQANPTQFSVEVRQSPYTEAQAAAKTAAAKKVILSASSTATADPGLEVKRQWVKNAASTWNIDWKLLEAVWQVETGKTWYTTRSSYAGATGPCQFMPGTWRAYAQDGNGDGVKNIYDARDCLFGSAKLLASNGASSGNIDGALLRYNHSFAYVTKVKRIMASIGD